MSARAIGKVPGVRPAPPVRTPAADPSLVEIRLRGAFDSRWLSELSTRWDAKVRVRLCRSIGHRPERLLRLIEIRASEASLTQIEAFIEGRSGVDRVSFSRLSRERILLWVSSPLPSFCRAVFEVGGVCTHCPIAPPSEDDQGDTWGVLLPRGTDQSDAVKAIELGSEGEAKLVRIGRYRGARPLTPRQERAIELAYRLGYFATPRKAALGEVAEALGTNRSTALEILRRGLQKLAAQHSERAGEGTGAR
jgi:hypothetical protein